MKKIYFYPFGFKAFGAVIPDYNDYCSAKSAIESNLPIIHTSSMANLSFDLLDAGYEIYLMSRYNKPIHIVPGMAVSDKELRRSHNILKMFIAGCFDYLIE